MIQITAAIMKHCFVAKEAWSCQ